jgi:hypothetical protein
MPKLSKRLLWIYTPCVVHFVACIVIVLARLESGWAYLVMVDTPTSVIIITLLYSFDHPFITFVILGTLWWYLVARGIEIVLVRTMARWYRKSS